MDSWRVGDSDVVIGRIVEIISGAICQGAKVSKILASSSGPTRTSGADVLVILLRLMSATRLAIRDTTNGSFR